MQEDKLNSRPSETPLAPEELNGTIPEVVEENYSDKASSHMARPRSKSIAKTQSAAGDEDDIVDREIDDFEDVRDMPIQNQEIAIKDSGFNGSVLGSRSFVDARSFTQQQHQIASNLTPLPYQRGRELLTLTVDLGDEGRENILIFQNDRPDQIAQDFCRRHQIDEKLKEMLVSHIANNMEQVKTELLAEMHQKSIKSALDPHIEPISSPQPVQSPNQRSQTSRGMAGVPREARTSYKSQWGEERINVDNNCNLAQDQSQKKFPSMASGRASSHKLSARDGMLSTPKQANSMSKLSLNLDREEEMQMTRNTLVSERYGGFEHFQNLYQRGMQMMEEKKRRHLEELRLKEEKEVEGLSFQPKLETRNKYLRYASGRPEQELHDRHKRYKERLEQKRIEKEIQEIKECVFKPKINHKSFTMARERSKKVLECHDTEEVVGANAFETLYKEAKAKQKRMQDRLKRPAEECTFTPSLSKISRKKANMLETTVQERLEKSLDLEKLQSKYLQPYDPKTGQVYFTPKINKKTPRNIVTPSLKEAGMVGHNIEITGDLETPVKKAEPVGDRLYKIAEGKQGNLDKRAASEHLHARIQMNQSHASQFSKQIMEGKKKKKFVDIFNHLDSDGDGFVSANKCNITDLSQAVLELVQPLLCSMEEKGSVLDMSKFMQEIQKHYIKLPHPDRVNLLEESRKREPYSDKNCNFHPSINSKSLRLAEKSNAEVKDVVSRLLHKKELSDKKKEAIQEQHKDDDLKNCTFKPLLLKEKMGTIRASSKKIAAKV